MIKKVDLLSYLPAFVQEYNEIQNIMNAETPEFQVLWDMDCQIRDNLFIITANETGVSRYERLLNIVPLADDTLETRRKRILFRIQERTPYTLKVLKNTLETLCGANNYDVELKHELYTLNITIKLSNISVRTDVISLLQEMIPSNLLVNLTSVYEVDSVPLYIYTHPVKIHTKVRLRTIVSPNPVIKKAV